MTKEKRPVPITYIHNLSPIRERRNDERVVEDALEIIRNGSIQADPQEVEWLEEALNDDLALLRAQKDTTPPDDLIA